MTGKAAFLRPLRMRLALILYQALLHLALPALVAVMLVRYRKGPRYPLRFADRFGFGPRAPAGAIWVLAASLGETRAVNPLVDRLLTRGNHVIMTHSSPAGLSESRRLFADAIARGQLTCGYIVADLFWAVEAFLRRNRPALGLVVESEIWPEILSRADRKGIPMVHVNGNITDRTVRRDAKWFGGARFLLFQAFQKILTKSEAHRERYLRIGVPADRVKAVGEMKFDQPVDPARSAHTARAGALRARWGEARRTFMIASSVRDEEDALFGLVATLLALPARPRIVWAPRSPQRFDAVAAKAVSEGVRVARRSVALDADLTGDIPGDIDILIGDSIGEMSFYYQLADLVFVGATLSDHGGHNIIEPLAFGRPVVIGPSMFGITFPAVEAIAVGACESLPDAEALTKRVGVLFQNPQALADFTRASGRFCENYGGASARSLCELRPWLPAPTFSVRAAEQDDGGRF